jgi:uncharacterized protein (DUF952 family)
VTRPSYHIVPAEVWERSDPTRPYAAASLVSEGFIHCTDGEAALYATADRHFGDDPRALLVLTLDLAATGSPWRVDDPTGIYPHVFGTIDRAAILAVQALVRDDDGHASALIAV